MNSSPGCLSPEDQDLLERSTKKKKTLDQPDYDNEGDVAMADQAVGREDHEARQGPTAASRRSFLETLVGINNWGKVPENAVTEEPVSEDEKETPEEDDEDCPVISLSKEEKARLRSPWKQTLILKVWGRTVNYNYLLRRLRSLWHPKASMELIAIENDHYLAKFASVDDYKFAKFEGPWMVLEHYLIIKSWTPNFDPHADITEKVLVWVRFPCLPIEYFDVGFLTRVGSKIGTPIKVDEATGMASRGKFARLCVEVDITKPLLSRFKLHGQVRRIEYEGIHLVCFECGVYGHKKEACHVRKGDKQTDKENQLMESKRQEESVSGQVGGSTKGRESNQETQEQTEPYGPWMLVPKRTRKKPVAQGIRNDMHREATRRKESPHGKSDSRFAILGIEDSEKEVENSGAGINEEVSSPMGSPARRGKRPAVLISEKQVETEHTPGQTPCFSQQRSHRTVRENNPGRKSRVSRQAAAESEHVVVRGSMKGKYESRKVVNYGDEILFVHETNEENMGEHFQDPPTTEFDPLTRDDMNDDMEINSTDLCCDEDAQHTDRPPGR